MRFISVQYFLSVFFVTILRATPLPVDNFSDRNAEPMLATENDVLLSKRWPRGRLDRFRFSLSGLGKRAPSVQDPSVFSASDLAFCSYCPDVDPMLSRGLGALHPDDRELVQKIRPALQDFVFDEVDRSSDLLDALLATNIAVSRFPRNNRSPEVFLEELYPIQSGTQQKEVQLDRNYRKLNSGNQPSDSPEDGMNMETGGKHGDYGSNGKMVHSMRDGQREIYPEIKMTKKWWAVKHFNRFRTPKSSSVPDRRLDPVFYFLGLGK